MDLLKNLNPEQKEATTVNKGVTLIIAGAGTGKTTVITKRIAWLIQEKKAKPHEILALTFTDKAAGEMEERVDKLLPYGYLDLWISTFHSFCERILRNHAIDIGLPNNFKLLDQTQQWLLTRKNLEKFNLDYYRPLGNPAKFIHALLKHFSRAKDEDITPKEYLEYVERQKLNTDDKITGKETDQEIKKVSETAHAYHTYQKLLLDNDSLDFGDLINYTLKLFRERTAILKKYQNQFKYLLIDEFQDTNYAQYELVKLLGKPRNNLTFCFDGKQSIYKFRGAALSNILFLKKDYPQSREIFLINNYRSFQNILDLAYKFIQLNDSSKEEDQIARNIKNKPLAAQNKGKAIIEHLHRHSLEEEAQAVIKKIIQLKNKKTSWDDFSLLLRANSQAEIFMNSLTSANIPWQFLASRGLYSKPIVLDILAYLKLLDNYHESSALYRIFNFPFFNFKSKDLINLTYWSKRKGWTLFETLKKISLLNFSEINLLNQINQLTSLIEKHTNLARTASISQMIYVFLEDSGYLKYLAEDNEIDKRDSLNYLNQFYKKAQDFERVNYDKSVKHFLEMINLELEAGEEGSLQTNPEEGPEAVKILTVHGAKGLEFKYVFIVNLVDLRFPSIDRKEAIELPNALIKENIPQGDIHLEEERRLFYVAMTRAKEGIFFTSAEDYGGQRKKKLSRFLYEIGMAEEKKKNQLDLIFFQKQPVIQKEKEKYDLPKRFSYSQLKAFSTCPYQYRFAYLLKIPVKGKAAFSFGKTIHLTLQRFFNQLIERSSIKQTSLFQGNEEKYFPPLDELLSLYEQSWIDDWYENKEIQKEYKEKGKKILKEFYEIHKKNQPHVLNTEQGINLKIGEYSFRGVIDRIDQIEGGLEIIDYKTGQAPKDEKYLEKDQLLIYQIAAEDSFQEKPILLSYYYLNENKKMSFLGKEKELKCLKEKIIRVIEEIKNNNFLPKPSKYVCQNCDFNDICEYREI